MINITKKYIKEDKSMNKKIKYTLFCAVLILTTAFVLTTVKSPGTGTDTAVQKNEKTQSENSAEINVSPEHVRAESKTDNGNVTKYILKYDGNIVVLITKTSSGAQTSHKVDGINPNYLTEYDLNQLRDGISVDSEAELYKLIEDFSS